MNPIEHYINILNFPDLWKCPEREHDLIKNKFCPRCGFDCVFKTYVFLDIDGKVFNDD